MKNTRAIYWDKLVYKIKRAANCGPSHFMGGNLFLIGP